MKISWPSFFFFLGGGGSVSGHGTEGRVGVEGRCQFTTIKEENQSISRLVNGKKSVPAISCSS